mmetsp:Transcript_1657/g.6518  ORF Transcript_1657/g.6518 Transcript_1657/m.6518 type:complete len:250 (+) Transcript_1657:687-1436(+)
MRDILGDQVPLLGRGGVGALDEVDLEVVLRQVSDAESEGRQPVRHLNAAPPQVLRDLEEFENLRLDLHDEVKLAISVCVLLLRNLPGAEDAEELIWVQFFDCLDADLGPRKLVKPDKDGISNLCQQVVDAAHEEPCDSAALHIRNHALLHEGPEDTTIAVRVHRDPVFFGQQEFATAVDHWGHALREQHEVLLAHSKELVLAKEDLDDMPILSIAHDVHGDVCRAPVLAVDEVLEPPNAFDVELEDGLV